MQLVLEQWVAPTTPVEELLLPRVVHQLVSQKANLASARCGYQRADGPLWPEFTGWQSKVTCEECIGW